MYPTIQPRSRSAAQVFWCLATFVLTLTCAVLAPHIEAVAQDEGNELGKNQPLTCKAVAPGCPKCDPDQYQCLQTFTGSKKWGKCALPTTYFENCNDGRSDCGSEYDCQDPPNRLGFCGDTRTWITCWYSF